VEQPAHGAHVAKLVLRGVPGGDGFGEAVPDLSAFFGQGGEVGLRVVGLAGYHLEEAVTLGS